MSVFDPSTIFTFTEVVGNQDADEYFFKAERTASIKESSL